MSVYWPDSRHSEEALNLCLNNKKTVAEAHQMISNSNGKDALER